ncbi:hypothetical protein DD237_000920 [Peronospora effusa]|uniref:Uncharacterized protein n=1 Tax=Peronospora effusa TaxID=542832 RepID=A0A425CNQ1_9STRA|nr:hypothetical protein DD237_000920 [Peronospora effusa]
MPRKDVRRDAVVSDKCLRLLYLKQEIQTDVKVLKPVIDEVNVLRLCHSLGMTLSSEGDPDSMHKFEFGLFNSDDYDTDFARFIRENVLVGNSCKEQKKEREDNEILEIGCLFGKQLEVKNELTRMEFWDSDAKKDYPLKTRAADRRQVVVFAWLGPSLFGPNAFRDTPAYVLRFLLTLSPNITCCLSQEDLRCIKSEVDAMSASSSMRWNSCSVAFRVQKQVKQEDSITYDVVTKMSIPKFSRIKSVWFVDGVIPSVAVENWAPSATEWITQHDVVSCGSFAQWLWEKHEEYLIELKPIQLHSTNAYDNVLRSFDKFPDEEMCALRGKYRDERAIAEQRFFLETFEYASKIFDDAVWNADVLFAVRCFANTSKMDLVQKRYVSFLQRCERFGKCEKYQTYKMLYLPERIQMSMELLYAAYRRHPSAFEELLNIIVAGDQIDADDRNNNWLLEIMHDVAHEVIGWFWQSYNHFSHSFRLAMEQHQPRLLKLWMEAVQQIVSEMQDAEFNQTCNNLLRIIKLRLIWMKKKLRNVLLAGFVNT